MSSFQSKPKQKNIYPEMLTDFEQNRKKEWLKSKLEAKKAVKPNQSFKDLDSRRLQMFSGKRGK